MNCIAVPSLSLPTISTVFRTQRRQPPKKEERQLHHEDLDDEPPTNRRCRRNTLLFVAESLRRLTYDDNTQLSHHQRLGEREGLKEQGRAKTTLATR